MSKQPLRRPEWLKVKLDTGREYRQLKKLLDRESLNTVCSEARCPNLHECWNAGTATFLILGDTCTRHCGFCSVTKGEPADCDTDEPRRIARAIGELSCRHAVITSVTRDDLPDQGAGIWAAVIRELKRVNPGTTCEALIPDFRGEAEPLAQVMAQRPEVLSHNVETVPELYGRVRCDSDFNRSLGVLKAAAVWQKNYPVRIKSGMMLGLGETRPQILMVMEELLKNHCQILTLGQYLSPTRNHLPVERFIPPEEFDELGTIARTMGFKKVESGPFVRSSYNAAAHLNW